MSRDLDGSTGQLGASASPITSSPFTIFCRFNPDIVDTFRCVFALIRSTSPFTYAALSLNADGPYLELYDGVEADTIFPLTTVTAGSWGCMTLTVSSATSRVGYCNGVAANGSADSIGSSGMDMVRVGVLRFGGTDFYLWNGKLAEPAVWDAALTADEVNSLERGISPLLVRPQSLVSYWPLYGRHSPEIDLVGGVGLTVSGTAPAAEHPRVILPRKRLAYPGSTGPTAHNRSLSVSAGWQTPFSRQSSAARSFSESVGLQELVAAVLVAAAVWVVLWHLTPDEPPGEGRSVWHLSN